MHLFKINPHVYSTEGTEECKKCIQSQCSLSDLLFVCKSPSGTIYLQGEIFDKENDFAFFVERTLRPFCLKKNY